MRAPRTWILCSWAGRVVKEGGALTGGRTEAARSLIEASRDRIVAELEPRGGLLPPAPEGWFEVTTQVMAQNLASAGWAPAS